MNGTSESRNLDMLRTIAVLYVVAYHVLLYFQITKPGGVNLQFGHWGVLLFFVHTSLVLMFSLERQFCETPNKVLFFPFYARRFFRIFPLSVLVVLAVYMLRLPVTHLHDGIFQYLSLDWYELLSNLLLVQNLTHTDSIIAPLWSLPYEIQMYLVLPLLFLIARASRNVYTLAIIWIGFVSVASIALHFHQFQVPDLLYYVPCFLAGIIAYKLAKSHTANLPFPGWPLALAAITIFYLHGQSTRRGWICCLLVALVLPQFREMRVGLLSRVCHKVARYSYGIYLTHFIALWYAFVALHALPMVIRCIAFLLILVLLPILLYHTVEAPMIALGHQWIERSKDPKPSRSRLAIKLSNQP
jgi:peptidoglycan/LPS O-acetylase OafA/YrhL